MVAQALRGHCCILDAEIVGIDRTTGQLLSFQQLSNRGRKNVDVNSLGASVAICVCLFDILFQEGLPLLDVPLRERRRLLHQLVDFACVPGELEIVREKMTR